MSQPTDEWELCPTCKTDVKVQKEAFGADVIKTLSCGHPRSVALGTSNRIG